jgi:protein TonB
MIKRLHWYNWTSIGMHLLLLLAMVEIQLTPKEMPVIESYEVDIVTDVPNAVKPAPGAKSAIAVKMKNTQAPKALDAIQKEKALPDTTKPELMPSKIEPPKHEEQEYEPPVQTRTETPARAMAPPVAGPGRVGKAPNEAAQWIGQVQALMGRVWNAPQGISFDDNSLKTTITLTVSKNGDLLSSSILMSSNNKPYDRTVLLSLSRLKRLPLPPAVLVGGKEKFDVTISFTPPKGTK